MCAVAELTLTGPARPNGGKAAISVAARRPRSKKIFLAPGGDCAATDVGIAAKAGRRMFSQEANIADLHDRIHRGAYRAKPSRRSWIPKPDGRQRPLGIAALEDKIVQQAVLWVIQSIFEQDFHGFSYGFRPGRDNHQALDALTVAICDRQVNWVLDADIQSFPAGRYTPLVVSVTAPQPAWSALVHDGQADPFTRISTMADSVSMAP